jgi:hypothetical protein
MARRRSKLTREGEPTQFTDDGVEIPVPKREELFDALSKAIRKQAPKEPSARSGRGKRRPSRDQ